MLMGEESLREGEESPLRRAKNPRDLSLLVKRYRLIEVSLSRVTSCHDFNIPVKVTLVSEMLVNYDPSKL